MKRSTKLPNAGDDDSLAIEALASRPSPSAPGLGLMLESAGSGRGPQRSASTAGGALSAAALLRWKGTIAIAFVLVNAVAQPCIWLLLHPEYRAAAAVYVSPKISRVVYKTEDNGVVPLYRQHVNTQAQLLRSTEVLERVLDRPSVRESRWYREEGRSLFGSAGGALDRLKTSLLVTPSGESEVINVSMRTYSAREAKLIVDAVVEEYEKVSRASVSDSDAEVYKQLTEEYARLQKEIEGLDALRYITSKEIGTLTPEELRSQRSTHLSVLESKRAEIERQLALARYELDALSAEAAPVPEGKALGVQPEPEAPAEQRYAGDTEWRELNIALQAKRHELDLARLQYGDSHPKLAQLNADVEYADRLLKDRVTQLDLNPVLASHAAMPAVGGGSPLPTLATLKREARRLEYELTLLSNDIEEQRERVLSAGDIAQRLAQYDEQLRRKREVCDPVRARLLVLQTESKAPLNIRIARASEPSRPDRDRRLLLAAMAVIGGLTAGLAFAYVRTTSDPTIREARDVPFTPQAPFLGRLPELSSEMDLAGDSGRPLQEHMRMVRTALLQRLQDSERGVVLISSCSAQTGKTSVSVLLGRSLAQLGKKVLLVEADLHRPCVAERLGLPPGPGLMDLLTGTSTDREAIVGTDVPRFEVLPAGERTAEFDAELLANGEFASCLRRWRAAYNFVLLDSPPVLPVADARILSRHADGTIMVLRTSHSRKPDVVQAYADLSAAGGTLLGTVLVGGGFPIGYGYYDAPRRPVETQRLLKA